MLTVVPSPDKRDYRNVGFGQKPVTENRTYQDVAVDHAYGAVLSDRVRHKVSIFWSKPSTTGRNGSILGGTHPMASFRPILLI
jgi:hypothetical protein